VNERRTQIYRCWVVWNKSILVVLVPLVFWLGFVVCGACVFYIQVSFDIGARWFTGDVFFFVTALLGCTIAINIYSSGRCFRHLLYGVGAPDFFHRYDIAEDMVSREGLNSPEHMFYARHSATRPTSTR
jgi:hypothetical protein